MLEDGRRNVTNTHIQWNVPLHTKTHGCDTSVFLGMTPQNLVDTSSSSPLTQPYNLNHCQPTSRTQQQQQYSTIGRCKLALQCLSAPDSWFMVLIRECIATYIYALVVYASLSTAVVDIGFVALARGITIATMCLMLNGATCNPVIAFVSLCVQRKGISSFISQISGQYIADVLAATTIAYGIDLNIGNAVPTSGTGGVGAGFVAEMVGTLALCLPVAIAKYNDTTEYGYTFWCLLVGAIHAALMIALGPVSGGFFDPFLTLGASLLSHFNDDSWIHYAGPVVGASVAVVLAFFVCFRTVKRRQQPCGVECNAMCT